MTSPPLQLEELVYDQVEVNARRDFDGSSEVDADVSVAVRFAQSREDERRWKVEVRVKVGQKEGALPPSYDVNLQAVGVFRVHPDYPAERMPKMVAVNATSVVYSSMRDFLMTVTARGPWGLVMLPTTSFVDLKPGPDPTSQEFLDLVVDLLRDRGAMPLPALAEAVGLPVDQLGPIIETLRSSGLIQATGRGRGTRYRIADKKGAGHSGDK